MVTARSKRLVLQSEQYRCRPDKHNPSDNTYFRMSVIPPADPSAADLQGSW